MFFTVSKGTARHTFIYFTLLEVVNLPKVLSVLIEEINVFDESYWWIQYYSVDKTPIEDII